MNNIVLLTENKLYDFDANNIPNYTLLTKSGRKFSQSVVNAIRDQIAEHIHFNYAFCVKISKTVALRSAPPPPPPENILKCLFDIIDHYIRQNIIYVYS